MAEKRKAEKNEGQEKRNQPVLWPVFSKERADAGESASEPWVEKGMPVRFVLSAIAVLAIAILVACAAQAPVQAPVQSPTPVPTSIPASTPTSEPAPVPTAPVATPTPWDREPSDRYAVGTPFTLKVGQSAEVDEGRLLVHLNAVVNDSRCPAGVVCVWAGNVAAVLEMSTQAGTARADLVFQSDRSSAAHDGYRIVVTEVQPYPRSAGTPIATADYVVSLVVESAPAT